MNTNLITWLLYDAGNSFLVTALGGMFLAQWVVLDKGFDDIWYGATFSLATLFVLLLSPFFGAWSDRIGKRMPFIKYLTISMYILNIVIVFITFLFPSNNLQVILVLLLFFFLQVLYQLSLVFYNALLDLLSSDKDRGKIVGLGELFGNMGWIVGLVVLLPFANGTIKIFGLYGRDKVFLPAFILTFIFTFPMIILFKENTQSAKTKSNIKEIYQETIQGIKNLFMTDKNIGVFLIGFCLASDVVQTVQLYFAVVMDQLFNISDSNKALILVSLYIIVMLSGFLIGKLSDNKQNRKEMLVFVCLLLGITTAIIFFVKSIFVLYTVLAFYAVGWGGFYVLSRAILLDISPKERLGEYFGFFSTFQKFASIVGPLTWGLVILLFKGYGADKYRFGILSLGIIMLFSSFILSKVKRSIRNDEFAQ